MDDPFAWFVPAAPVVVVVAVMMYLVVYPFLTLCHELGHAVVSLWTIDGEVVVRLGVDPVREVSIGRFTLAVSAFPGLAGGSCSFAAYPDGRVANVALFLAGPVVSLVAFCTSVWLVTVVSSKAMRLTLLLVVVQQGTKTALTAIPMEYQSELGLTEPAYDGMQSDGDLALTAWRQGGPPETDTSD